MFRNFRTFWHVTSFTTSGHVTKDWSLSPCLIYIYRYKHNTDNVQMISHDTVHTVQMISHSTVHTVQMISHNTVHTVQMISYNTVHTVQMISHSTVHTVQMISYNHRQTSSAPPTYDCLQLPTVPATHSFKYSNTTYPINLYQVFYCYCYCYCYWPWRQSGWEYSSTAPEPPVAWWAMSVWSARSEPAVCALRWSAGTCTSHVNVWSFISTFWGGLSSLTPSMSVTYWGWWGRKHSPAWWVSPLMETRRVWRTCPGRAAACRWCTSGTRRSSWCCRASSPWCWTSEERTKSGKG